MLVDLITAEREKGVGGKLALSLTTAVDETWNSICSIRDDKCGIG